MFDSDIHVMNILWDEKRISAKDLSNRLMNSIGWNKNTTYTIIKRLIQKGYIKRIDPGFICVPIISRKDIQTKEVTNLIDKLYQGSKMLLFSSLIDDNISEEEIAELKNLLNGKS